MSDSAEQGEERATPDKQVKFKPNQDSNSQEERDIKDIDEDTILQLDISEAELEDIKKEFNYFDKENDGNITLEDFATVIRGQGFNPSDEELQEMTSQYDTEGTGTLDFRDVVTIIGHEKLKCRDVDEDDLCRDLVASFKVFDKDNNGYISAAELRYILTSMGEMMTDEEVDEMLRCAIVDSEAEDRVEYEEFAILLASKMSSM